MWSSSFIQGVFSIDASTFGIACSRMTLVFDCWKRIATFVSALQAEIICLDDPPTAPLIAYALQWHLARTSSFNIEYVHT